MTNARWVVLGGGRPGVQVPMGVRTLLQLSNEKIDKVMEETAQVRGRGRPTRNFRLIRAG
jgi:hypothetical protein